MKSFIVTTDVIVQMRDGVELRADVYRPATERGPVLLTRTPYDKNRVSSVSADLDIFRALRAGYAVVVQDVRGRFASDGHFSAHRQESADGADAMRWLLAQPWCDGRVGTFGKSYLGGTQWFLAAENPLGLKAMAPSMTPSDGWEGMFAQGGITAMHTLRWAVGVGGDEARKRAAGGDEIPPDWQRDFDLDAALSHLPLNDHPAYGEVAPFWPEWVSRPSDEEYWRAISPNERYDRIDVPVLNIGGWYDIFTGPVIENFLGARSRGGAGAAKSKLIIGPWSHADLSGNFPERDFGPRAGQQGVDLDGLQLRWFDRWVREVDNGVDKEPPVLIFVMDIDEWRAEADWPLPQTKYVDYFLHSQGKANTRSGDGSLSEMAPSEEPADSFVYDPHDPVPTIGGQVLLPGPGGHGPRDQV